MIWLNFEHWNYASGLLFTRQRIYRKGYIWTPFVRVRLRKHKPVKLGSGRPRL